MGTEFAESVTADEYSESLISFYHYIITITLLGRRSLERKILNIANKIPYGYIILLWF